VFILVFDVVFRMVSLLDSIRHCARKVKVSYREWLRMICVSKAEALTAGHDPTARSQLPVAQIVSCRCLHICPRSC